MSQPRTIATEDESPGTVCAVLLDPGADAMVVTWVDLATLPAEPGRWGPQLAPEGVVGLIGKRVAQHCLHAGEWLLVGEGEGQAWRISGHGPFRGRGIVLAYDRLGDAYHSTRFTEASRALVEPLKVYEIAYRIEGKLRLRAVNAKDAELRAGGFTLGELAYEGDLEMDDPREVAANV